MRGIVCILALAVLAGCAEEPPGNLAAVGSEGGYWTPDTVKARVLGRTFASDQIWWGRLDSTEQAWLDARGYEVVGKRIDTTATDYFRSQAERLPRWDKRTLMTEWVFVRSASPGEEVRRGGARAAAPDPLPDTTTPAPPTRPEEGSVANTWGIVVGSVADSASASVLVKKYKERLALRPVSVRRYSGVEGDATRFRVVAGRFDSVAVYRALDRHRETLPEGAWLLRFR